MPFVVVDSFVSAVAECSTGAFSADRETSGCVRCEPVAGSVVAARAGRRFRDSVLLGVGCAPMTDSLHLTDLCSRAILQASTSC